MPLTRGWTSEDIAEAIKEAFRRMPNTSIWVRSRNRHVSAGLGGDPSQTWDVIAFSATILGHGSEEHQALLLWARMAAQTGQDLASNAEAARHLGVNASTIWRRRKRACDRMARAKNESDLLQSQGSAKLDLDSAIAGAGSIVSLGDQPGP